MSKRGFRTAGLLFAAMGVILSACAQPPDKLITCPAIRIPQDTERVTRFAPGEGRDITDVVMQAEVKFLSGECPIDDEEIEMTFPIAVRGLRGPAESDGIEDINVFIAVSTRDRQVLSRRELPMNLRFQGNRNSIVTSDIVTIDIPKTPEQSSKDFLVFIGLVLSEQELAYNREESRR